MNINLNAPGIHVFPNGSDVLWALAHHLKNRETQKEPHILLPTQRSVNRLKGLLYTLNVSAPCTITPYHQTDAEAATSIEHQLLWKVCNTPSIYELFLKSAAPPFQQRFTLFKHLTTLINELMLYEVTPQLLMQTLSEQGITTHNHYANAFQLYEKLLKEQATAPLVQQQVAQYNVFKSSIKSASDIEYYLVLDGPTPPAIFEIAHELCSQHTVLLKQGSYADKQKRFRDEPQISNLDLFVPRKPLLNAIQSPSFYPVRAEKSWESISMIEADNLLQLAQTVINISEANFTLGERVVTLVTPNRQLAKIVSFIASEREIAVDDSFGAPLINTPIIYVFFAILKWFQNPSNYANCLTVITHTLAPLTFQKIAQQLDILARTQQLTLSEALSTYIPQDNTEQLCLDTLSNIISGTALNFDEALKKTLDFLHSWQLPESEQTVLDLAALKAAESKSFEMLDVLLSTTTSQTLTPPKPLLQIIGPLEARLLNPKVVLIADLNETEWPLPKTSSGLPEAVKKSLSLLPSSAVSDLSSEVFLSLLASPKVYLLRTLYQESIETLPSKWWTRLKILSELSQATVDEKTPNFVKKPKDPLNLNTCNFILPPALRPNRLSISQFQQLIQKSESFVLETLLRLPNLPLWNEKVDHKEKGILIHDVLKIIIENQLPPKAALEVAEQKLKQLPLNEVDYAFWNIDIRAQIQHFFELNQLQTTPQKSWLEVKAEWLINTPHGPITLVGKADRIDQMEDGSFHIIDYKTGALPAKKEVLNGKFPQLAVLGFMLKYGAFKDIPNSTSPFLVSYWGLKDATTLAVVFEDLLSLEEKFIAILTNLLNPNTTMALKKNT